MVRSLHNATVTLCAILASLSLGLAACSSGKGGEGPKGNPQGDLTNPGDQGTPTPDNTPVADNPVDDQPTPEDPWEHLHVVWNGMHERLVDAQKFDSRVQEDHSDPIACASGIGVRLDPVGFVCVDDPYTLSLSLCKNHAQECGLQAEGIGQIYLDCELIGAKFGSKLKNWCLARTPKAHCTADMDCGTLGVSSEYKEVGGNKYKKVSN